MKTLHMPFHWHPQHHVQTADQHLHNEHFWTAMGVIIALGMVLLVTYLSLKMPMSYRVPMRYWPY